MAPALSPFASAIGDVAELRLYTAFVTCYGTTTSGKTLFDQVHGIIGGLSACMAENARPPILQIRRTRLDA